ncbi:MAG: fimbria/pilus outer membrane usher protein, partial [Terriglobales bacterium]
PSAFFNYSLTTQDLERVSLSGESGLSLDGMLLFNSFTRNTQGQFVRGFTNLTLDNRERLRRWVIGDSFAGASGLGGSLLLGGVSLSRNFGLDPYFVRYPTLTYSGAALSATTVEIYINDTLVRREQLPPGPFELRNLPVVAGRGSARIVLRDAFGRLEDVVLPGYFSSRVLAKGLSEYSYHLGLRRENTGTRSWDYGPLAFLGQHRFGVTDSLTAGFRLEATRDLVNGGPAIQARLPFGEIEVAAAASHAKGTSGAAASLAYTYLGRPASLSASLRLLSPRYAHLNLEPERDRARFQANASASFHLHPRAGLTLQYAFSHLRDRGRNHRPSFLANLRVTRRATLLLSGSHMRDTGRPSVLELFGGVSYYLGKNTTANVSHRDVDGRGTTTFEVQKSLPVGEGFGYRVQAQRGTQERLSGLFHYSAPFGRYEAQFDRSAGRTSTTLRLSGGSVSIGGRMYFTRPVQDAFALIRVPGVARVQGYFSNQKIGRTDARGDLLIP